jgi:hypothetical protein
VLVGAARPQDVFLASGELMAHLLKSEGFRWLKSKTRLVRRADSRLEEIRLEPSRWNRTGKLVEFGVTSLRVYDDRLMRWRRSHPELTVKRPPGVAGIVCATSIHLVSLECQAIVTYPEGRAVEIDRICRHIQEVVLPWFQASSDPATVATAVPDLLLHSTGFAQDLLEFLVSSDRQDQAVLLMRRVQAIGDSYSAGFAEGRDLAAAGGRPKWHTPQAVGWSSYMLDLL